MSRIGILGGSFNPVHEGHLALARFAYSELNLDRIYFVPASQSPLKATRDVLPADLRVKLLQKALKKYPNFSVSTCEIDRGGKSYTVDTLRFLHRQSKEKSVFYFLAGMDCLETLPQWKSVDQIFKLCRFVVATRPGYDWEETQFPIIRLPFEALDVSSSQLRRRLGSGLTVEGLIPKEIQLDLQKFYAKTKVKKGVSSSKRKKS